MKVLKWSSERKRRNNTSNWCRSFGPKADAERVVHTIHVTFAEQYHPLAPQPSGNNAGIIDNRKYQKAPAAFRAQTRNELTHRRKALGFIRKSCLFGYKALQELERIVRRCSTLVGTRSCLASCTRPSTSILIIPWRSLRCSITEDDPASKKCSNLFVIIWSSWEMNSTLTNQRRLGRTKNP